MILNRRSVVLGSGALLAAGAAQAQDDEGLTLTGRFVQGGHALGRTWPRALIFVDGESLTAASADGVFIVGFDRDAAGSVQVEARLGGRTARRTLDIARGQFPSTSVNGLPPSTVEPSDPELLARIQREIAIKTEGFASRIDADHFRDGFDWPLEAFRVTSRWGSQRILNGTPARPHYGIDLAVPQGTVIRAPAAGRVTFARSGLHFEGGLVLIDHGQGLITAYLHQSRIDVVAGQELRRGEALGRVGMTGRATGPHLCWRMKWRDRNLDPSLLVKT
ncbi:MAG: M23 family metallopeptidase [Brevundimonas sp.]|uniref:M23 family metallopeptidase n=1 Tax=Brevundimonas sp. TaxID=1871086 RepID=UPI00271EF666|nr:M23 family metallopeptidase [Brevundimonas sp.]MDO9076996.1 M23 family metallopeptidase [Brevundimonas sp.]MDZ4062389.1 M23 family metallopeptidase [Brevundimonas sp.]